jgi:hypothetical protein
VALGVVVALAGCGTHAPRPAALRVERTDLVLLGHALQGLEGRVHAEVGTARAVWPTLARGLPTVATPATRRAIAAADARAGALALPSFATAEAGLTGPAAGIGGLLKHYVVLARRGWRFIAAAAGVGPSAGAGSTADRGTSGTGPTGPTDGGPGGADSTAGDAASGTDSTTAEGGASGTNFLRANAGLYIYCVYDGHYDLSLIGKEIVAAYAELGGPAAFGSALTAGRVAALARAYSIPAVRLAPHPVPGVQV